MKKTLATVLLAVLALLWGGYAEAGNYVVKKGDTLWDIAKENFGDPMVSNIIYSLNVEKMSKGPDYIYPGQKLEMPEKIVVAEREIPRVIAKESAPKTVNKVVAITKTVKKKAVKAANKIEKKVVAESTTGEFCKNYTDSEVGDDPWKGSVADGLKLLGIFVPQGAEIRFSEEEMESLQLGETFRMVSGKNKVGFFKSGLTEGKSQVKKLGVIVDGNKIAHVWQKPECANWIRRFVTREEEEPVKETPVAQATPPGLDLIIPPLRKKEEAKKYDKDEWDWYLGAGNYQNRIDPGDNHGYYYWTKGRIRPWWMDLDENQLGIKGVGLGFFGFLAGGEGIAAEHYDYDWQEAVIGATAKVYAENSDYDFDLGWGKLWNEGSWMGQEDRDQVDEILLVSIHGNFYREGNPDWLPKREINLEYRHILNSEMRKGGTAVNNEMLEISLTQWIYKFHLGEGDSFNVSPGINLGLGYEKASEDEEFFKTGPAFEFTSYKHVVGAVSLFNYKFQGDGQWHPISFYWSPDGTSRAYEASQITSVSAEELRGFKALSPDKSIETKIPEGPADHI